MDSWDEIRTAFQVAKAGTVSGAADMLGVHHATVIRHIDALESRLGAKLFQRHARGYTPTEAGADLMRVAQVTDDQFTQLAGRIKGLGEGVEGDLVITSLMESGVTLIPAIAAFCKEYPKVRVQLLTDARVFRLEYGEAHVAIRAGQKPKDPDNVVQPLIRIEPQLVASQDYLARMGTPRSVDDFAAHRFVAQADPDHRAPFSRWLAERVEPERVAFRASDPMVGSEAIRNGLGIGFVSAAELVRMPDLVRVMDPLDEWMVDIWLVTHVDLHRSAKVQAFSTFLKAWLKDHPI